MVSKQKNKKKGGGTPEALLRARFLLGASALAANRTTDTAAGAVLSAHLGSHLIGVTKKAVLRVKPEVKRSLCKGCRVTLVAGKTAKVTLEGRGKGKKTVWHCRQCGTTKSMLIKEKKPYKRIKKGKKK